MKIFQFHKQLKTGDAGEQWLLQNYDRPLRLYEGREFDFYDDLNRRVELKTETRSLEDSPNFFIERWSDISKKKPGGPWQSVDKADVLVYLFLPSQTYFVFDSIPLLISEIEERKLTLKEIQNKGFTAGGFVVKRNSLAHLFRMVQVLPLSTEVNDDRPEEAPL